MLKPAAKQLALGSLFILFKRFKEMQRKTAVKKMSFKPAAF